MSESFLKVALKKIIELSASLVILAALTFFLLKLLPGGPFDDETALHPLVKEKLSVHWEIDSAWHTQAVSYGKRLLLGDMGVSMARPERTVVEIIGQSLGRTLLLNFISLMLVLVGAWALATLALRFRGGFLEQFLDQVVLIFLSLPSLFWGPLLIFVFGFYFNLLPTAFLTSAEHYILPLLTLSVRPMASLARILKNSMQDNLQAEYVRTARAKGLSEARVLFSHVLPNSWIPFVSYLGPLLVSLISGSVLVEVLFAVPGIGTEFVTALGDRDYTLILGLTLFFGSLLMVINTLMDLLMRLIDPRMQETR